MDRSFLPVAALGVALALGISAPANAQEVDEGIPTEDLVDRIGPLEAVIVGHLPAQTLFLEDGDDEAPGEIVYDLYEEDSLADLFTHLDDPEVAADPVEPVPSEASSTLGQALRALHALGHETIWVHFVSEGALRSASRRDLKLLGRRVDRQEVVASIYGSDLLLRDLVALPTVQPEGPHQHDGRLHVVRMNKAEDHLEQWTHDIPDAPSDRARFVKAVIEFEHWLYDQRQDEILSAEDEAQSAPNEDFSAQDVLPSNFINGKSFVWTPIFEQTFGGAVEGIRVAWDDEPQASGHWSVELKVWYTRGTVADFYLIQLKPTSRITNYKKNGALCGWWTSGVQASLRFDRGVFLEYMPQGTLKNKEEFFSIGGVAWAQGFYGGENQEIRTTADPSPGNQYIVWDVSLRGCNSHGTATWTGASEIARTYLEFGPAAIAMVPDRRDLVFKLQAVPEGQSSIQFTEVRHEKQAETVQVLAPVGDCDVVLDGGLICKEEELRRAAPPGAQVYCHPPTDTRKGFCQFVPFP